MLYIGYYNLFQNVLEFFKGKSKRLKLSGLIERKMLRKNWYSLIWDSSGLSFSKNEFGCFLFKIELET